MSKLVTIGLPVYKRLHYLPSVLKIVAAQDYPDIELLVSDNGCNESAVRKIVDQNYPKPYKFRQNEVSAPFSQHWNQILNAASGEYFVMLADDDEISENYVSELAGALDRYPQASVALCRQETINEDGAIIRQSREGVPPIVSGADFIWDAWYAYKFRFECFATILARTNEIRARGGYPLFTRGNHIDNGLLIKLCINNYVAFSDQCAFRWRHHESSHGWSISIQELAESSVQFLQFLESDPRNQEFAALNPARWKELKECLVRMTWETYFGRWNHLYRSRLSSLQWIRAAFAMPFIPGYYREVAFVLANASKAAVRREMKNVGKSGQ